MSIFDRPILITGVSFDGTPLSHLAGGQVQVSPCSDCGRDLHYQVGAWWEFRDWNDFKTWHRHRHQRGAWSRP